MHNAKPLLLGLLVIAVALGLFIFLAQLVVPPASTWGFESEKHDAKRSAETDALAPELDRATAERFHEDARESPGALAFFHVMTDIGDKVVMTTFSVAVLLVLLWWRQWGLAVAWVIVTVGAVELNTGFKDYWHRLRPSTANYKSYSFPSGHAMNVLADFGMLAYLLMLGVRTRWLRNSVIAALGVLVLLIGFSRIYLTDHWLTDVVGGFSLATVWLGCNVLVIEVIRRYRAPVPEPAAAELEKVA